MLIRLLRSHLGPYRRDITLIVLLQLVQTLASLFLPTLNADIIDDGVVKGDIGRIISLGGIMLAVALIQIVCTGGAVYFGARTAMALGRDVRASIFHRVQAFSAREVGGFGTPSLITRTTNDVQQVMMLVLMTFTMMVAAPIMMVGSIVMALRLDIPMTGILVAVLPILGVFIGFVVARMRPLFRTMQERIDRVNQVLREQITGVRVIRAFVRDDAEEKRFAVANTDVYDVGLAVTRLMAFMFPVVMLVFNIATICVLWVGGHQINSGDLEVGQLTALISYLMQNLMAVMMATFMFMMLPRAEVCAERIQEILDTGTSVVPPREPVRPGGETHGHLDFDGVEFRFPGAEEPVLCDISLIARPGETTAVIGSTGSGKTTMLNLIPRLMDATGGRVLIDGVDVRELDPETLSELVAFVPQKPYLFSGTVASNLRYGRPDATDEELWHALEIAQAGFVRDLEGGLEANIAQGGTNVSGGQRQRLAIARALVRRPQIYLFDDSFSALDYATDAALRAALSRETSEATVVIVAQRVSTIRNADRIVVLEEGRVCGIGTHEELMDGNQTYREIVLSQLTEAEAA
ncbi:ABC transporter ATP-binding protein [Actinocorallia longicatena]|uniref:ABC transporter ATP-binding protein n=1 Tax=Actinocorallia longicatena TaxID=111803 RepID=A0ABP6PZY8_9ACTN